MPKYQDKIAFVPVSLDRSLDDTRHFLSQNDLKFSVYAKPDSEALSSLDIRYIPSLVLVSKSGEVISVLVGAQNDAEMIRLLDALIK